MVGRVTGFVQGKSRATKKLHVAFGGTDGTRTCRCTEVERITTTPPMAEEVLVAVPKGSARSSEDGPRAMPNLLKLTAPGGKRRFLVQPPQGCRPGHRLPVSVPAAGHSRGFSKAVYAVPPEGLSAGRPFICRADGGAVVVQAPAAASQACIVVAPDSSSAALPTAPEALQEAMGDVKELREQLRLLRDPRLRGTPGVDTVILDLERQLRAAEQRASVARPACSFDPREPPTCSVPPGGGSLLVVPPSRLRRAGQLFAVLLSDGRVVAVAATSEALSRTGNVIRVQVPALAAVDTDGVDPATTSTPSRPPRSDERARSDDRPRRSGPTSRPPPAPALPEHDARPAPVPAPVPGCSPVPESQRGLKTVLEVAAGSDWPDGVRPRSLQAVAAAIAEEQPGSWAGDVAARLRSPLPVPGTRTPAPEPAVPEGSPDPSVPEGLAPATSPLAVAYNRAVRALAGAPLPHNASDMDTCVSLACHALTLVSDLELSCLRFMSPVPLVVSLSMSTVLSVLGYSDVTWMAAKSLLKPDLIRAQLSHSQRFASSSHADMPTLTRHTVGELLADKMLRMDRVLEASLPCAVLLQWVRASLARATQRGAAVASVHDAPPEQQDLPPPSPEIGGPPPPDPEAYGKSVWVPDGGAGRPSSRPQVRTGSATDLPRTALETLAFLEGLWRSSLERKLIRVQRCVGGQVEAQYQQTTGAFGQPHMFSVEGGVVVLLGSRVRAVPTADCVRWTDGDMWQRLSQRNGTGVLRDASNFGLLPSASPKEPVPPRRPAPRSAWDDPAAAPATPVPSSAHRAAPVPCPPPVTNGDTRPPAGSGVVMVRSAVRKHAWGPQPPGGPTAVDPWRAAFPDGAPATGALTDDQLRQLFAALDTSSKGWLSAEELQEFVDSMDHMGAECPVDRILASFQAPRGRGRRTEAITFAEFAIVMLHISAR
eukprot:TRINITY_DN11885_c1_g1_i2.p1 TRINITY_DN11885_c1_g1~~TRINITY_DN11885_c1_g1_i2.p1  ORF type:complete len:1028 (+),score=251.25 TRINITY_DN11885_c1_g1_i2:276-3086(+)